jgi:hypothetical protein
MHTDASGRVYTVATPAFLSPQTLGTQEAYFGTKEKAEEVLMNLPYSERPSNVPLRKYKAQVFEDITQRRAEIAASRPFVAVETEKGKTFYIKKPKKLTEAQKSKRILGSDLTWGDQRFTTWEKSARQKEAQIRARRRPTIAYSSRGGMRDIKIFNPDRAPLPRLI